MRLAPPLFYFNSASFMVIQPPKYILPTLPSTVTIFPTLTRERSPLFLSSAVISNFLPPEIGSIYGMTKPKLSSYFLATTPETTTVVPRRYRSTPPASCRSSKRLSAVIALTVGVGCAVGVATGVAVGAGVAVGGAVAAGAGVVVKTPAEIAV